MDRWQPCTADTAPIVECTVTYEVHCNLTKIIRLKRDSLRSMAVLVGRAK